MKNLPIKSNTKCRNIKEDGFEHLYKRYLLENERNQKTYTMVYGVPSIYLERHKQVFTWIRNNREYFTKVQEHFILYNFFCRDVIDIWHERINREKKTFLYKESYSRLNSVRVPKKNHTEEYSSEIGKHSKKSSFIFNYPSDQLIKSSIDTVIDKFNSEKIVCYDSLKPNKKLAFVQQVIKLFPSVYIITMDNSFMNKLMRKKDLEIGVIRSRTFYKCNLHISTDKDIGMESFLFKKDSKKSKIWDKRLCKKYHGKEYCEFLSKYDCPLHCKYYLDHLQCSRSHTVGMRPFTFFVETTFSTGSFESNPRSLIVIDNVKLLVDNLTKFYTFEVPEKDCRNLQFRNNFKFFKEDLQILLDREIYKEKTYEKMGWVSLIKQLQNSPPKNGLWPAKPHPYYNESYEYLYRILLKENRSYIEGLDKNNYKKLCDTKKAIYSIKLALHALKPYEIERIGGKCIFIPKDYNHLIKAHVEPYGSYFLLLNTVNSEYYKSGFCKIDRD